MGHTHSKKLLSEIHIQLGILHIVFAMSSNPKRKVKLALFIGALIVYLENPRDYVKKKTFYYYSQYLIRRLDTRYITTHSFFFYSNNKYPEMQMGISFSFIIVAKNYKISRNKFNIRDIRPIKENL